jgi:hypothetical protein
MKNWQFWLVFLVLAAIFGELADIGYQSGEIFNQARWMTWKLDQDSSDRIKVDVR